MAGGERCMWRSCWWLGTVFGQGNLQLPVVQSGKKVQQWKRGKSSLIQHSKSIKHKNIADRADAVFFIYAGTPGMVYHEQVILNIGWQKMKLAVDLSVWTIYCMKHIFVLKLTFFCQTWIFFLDLRTFLSNFVPTDVNALLLKSYPEDFRPILSWASSNPILGRNLSSTPELASPCALLII